MYHLPWTNIRLIPAKEPSVVWDLKSYKNGELVDFSKLPQPSHIELFTETGAKIDTSKCERPEQCLALSYVDPSSTVLELGARYGSVTCIINKKLKDKTKQVSVEPDPTVWAALEQNILRNGCSVWIHKGFVSKKTRNLLPFGYGATSVVAETSTIHSVSVEDIESLYNLKFDTLVADCEGFLEEFFGEHPQLYDQLHTVIFEADYPQKCNYDKLRTELKNHGFHEIITGFQNVFKKKAF
jgi:FkbM family methyltransferase